MTFITKEKFDLMFDMQAGFNTKLLPTWKTNPPPYTDAIWTEAAEAFNYTSWEWWKNSGKPVNMEQMKMEIVDIWHFLMSEVMTYAMDDNLTYFQVFSVIEEAIKAQKPANFVPGIESVKVALRNLIVAAALPPSDNRPAALMTAFCVTMDVMEFTWTDLFKLYIGKNTLNTFRQKHGYKTNTDAYKAIWAFGTKKEDNEYLTEILKAIDIDSEDVTSQIVKQLDETFSHLNYEKDLSEHKAELNKVGVELGIPTI